MENRPQNSNQISIRLFCLDDCAPCTLVKQAVALMAPNMNAIGVRIEEINILRVDRKALGKVMLSGVTKFPTVRILSDKVVVKSFVSVVEGWSASDIAEFLSGQVSDCFENKKNPLVVRNSIEGGT